MSAELGHRPPQEIKSSPLNFEEFSNQPEYIEVNRGLIRKLGVFLPIKFSHVDVAAGTGMAEKLLIEEAQRTGRKGKIIGIDPNITSLEIAKRTTPHSENVSVEFLVGSGQDLKTLVSGKCPGEGVDGVSILDAIHEIPGEDKQKVLAAMVSVLKPGGVLACNSAFTTAAVDESPRLWGQWKVEAFKILGGERKKEKNPNGTLKTETLKPEKYREMMEASDLFIVHDALEVVTLSKRSLRAISAYPRFAEGVFSDMINTAQISIEEKSKALIQALDKINADGLKRIWHEIIAIKSAIAKEEI